MVVRLQRFADIGRLEEVLGRHGGYVESPGRGVVTAVVSARGLSEVSGLGEVLAIDEPKELHGVVQGEERMA